MSKLQFITYSIGILALGMIYSYCFMNKYEEQETKDYTYENNNDQYNFKTFEHKTWYGDTMLVTVDTTYFYKK